MSILSLQALETPEETAEETVECGANPSTLSALNCGVSTVSTLVCL
ncbi:SapB/AmfS family lanthipeptide [Kitasatospora sp. HPMI-4]